MITVKQFSSSAKGAAIGQPRYPAPHVLWFCRLTGVAEGFTPVCNLAGLGSQLRSSPGHNLGQQVQDELQKAGFNTLADLLHNTGKLEQLLANL